VTAAEAPAPRFLSLIPDCAERSSLTAEQALGSWWLDGEREPRVAINMIASLDGRIAINGRSAALGGPADRALFHTLRARADAVMAAAGTVRAERYGPIIRSPQTRRERAERGLPAQPLAVIVSRRLDLDPQLPLLADPESRVAILTPGSGTLPRCAAKVEYVRGATLREGLEQLRRDFGADRVLCEGGPSLNASLAAESLIDELFLSLSPQLVGDSPGGGTLLRGNAPPVPLALELSMLLANDSQLFAHYVSRG
jgi:riboflavin biosynthesis pyrimidine reductase